MFTPLVVCSVITTLVRLSRSEPKLHYQTSFPDYNTQVEYGYRYAIDDVESGVISDKWEERRGEYVKGAYSLLEPSGKVRTVNYEVDGDGGFHAIVKTSYPAHYLLSTQQYLKAQQRHPQPSPEHNLGPSFPDKNRQDDEVPVNYHAINAEVLGYRKLMERSKRLEGNNFRGGGKRSVHRFNR